MKSTSSNVQAVLFDDGNLVLMDGENSKLWDSLEYPSHTWMPGGGCVRHTKLDWSNTSTVKGKRDKFWMSTNMVLPDKPQFVSVESAGECESTCLKFSDGKSSKGVVLGAVAGAVTLVILAGLIMFVVTRRRLATTTKTEGSLMAFVYRDLQNATKNFSERLGGGGFGSVLKGTLPDLTVIAVKKLEGPFNM
ncbi:hypothetical protein AgCh_003693 [Apium graveolens]